VTERSHRQPWGELRQVNPKGPVLVIRYRPTVDPDGGGGGWRSVERPRRVTALEWAGVPLRTLTVGILLWRGGESIEDPIGVLDAMGRPRARLQPPPELEFVCPPWSFTGTRWVIGTPLQISDELHNRKRERIRALATIKLARYIVAGVAFNEVERTPSAASEHFARRDTAIVRSGDTLESIAIRHFGDHRRAPEIGELNGIRDPRRLTIGARLQLPA
jgi:nucleoid-associated protein YgaU